MTKWDFLSQWSDVLRPLAVAATPVANHDSLVPRISRIEVTLPRDISPATLLAVRQAMELMGRALVIDSSLWAKMRSKPKFFEHDKGDKYVDPRAFRDEDLQPSFELVWNDKDDCMEYEEWLKCASGWLSEELQSTRGEFAMAMEKLQAQDVFSVAASSVYQVPVSLCVLLVDSSSAKQLAIMLERINSVTCATQQGRLRRLLRLTHVNVTLLKMDNAIAGALVRIQAVGIAVHSVTMEFANVIRTTRECVSPLVGPGAAFMSSLESLEVRSGNTIEPTGVLHAALLHGPETLAIAMFPSIDPDWLLLCNAVRAASTQPRQVRRIDIELPNLTNERATDLATALKSTRKAEPMLTVRANIQTRAGAKLDKKLQAKGIRAGTQLPAIAGTKCVLLLLPDGHFQKASRSSVVVVPPPPPVEPVAVVDQNPQERKICVRLTTSLCDPDGLSPLLAFVQCFGPHVTALDLTIVADSTFTAGVIASILESFPRLECLKLSHTELTTMDVFLDTYRGQRCQLRVLSIDSGHVGFVPFFEELATMDRTIAKTLLELTIGFPRCDGDDGKTYLGAITVMLTQNHVLQFMKLTVATVSVAWIDSVAAALRPFHRTPLAYASGQRMPMKAKLTFLAAMAFSSMEKPTKLQCIDCRQSSRGRVSSRLDRGPQALILAFAAPCLKRILLLNHEKSRSLLVARCSGGTQWFDDVRADFVGL